MRTLCVTTIFLFAAAVSFGQTVADCPHADGCVVISRAAALKALEDSDARKALEAKAKTDERAINDLKTELENMRREFIRASTELSVVKQQRVEDRALFEFVLKNQRRKCYPFSICIGT